jgi:hypothetical protein
MLVKCEHLRGTRRLGTGGAASRAHDSPPGAVPGENRKDINMITLRDLASCEDISLDERMYVLGRALAQYDELRARLYAAETAALAASEDAARAAAWTAAADVAWAAARAAARAALRAAVLAAAETDTAWGAEMRRALDRAVEWLGGYADQTVRWTDHPDHPRQYWIGAVPVAPSP